MRRFLNAVAMSKKSLVFPPPTPIALVICDDVRSDRSGKRSLVGLFNRIVFSRFPAKQNRVCVFVSVTSLRPSTICKIDLVNAETDEPLAVMQGPLQNHDPVIVCDLVFRINNLRFRTPGTYYVRFWGNDQILMQRAFEVLQAAPRKRPA